MVTLRFVKQAQLRQYKPTHSNIIHQLANVLVSIPIHKQSWLHNIKIWNVILPFKSGTRLVSFPGFPAPEQEDVYMERTFLMWPWHNQNRTRVFRTDRQCTAHCSTNCAFNTQCVWYSPPDNQRCVASRSLPLLFFLFWVFGYAHAQLRSLYPLSTLDDFLEHGSLGTSLKPHFFAINFRDPIWTRM